MGNTIKSYTSTKNLVDNVKDFLITGQKRKRNEIDEQEETNKIIDLAIHTPKRKRLLSTAQYVYQALFKEGKNSDITVEALGVEFHLHKVYLCQSPYFASMFGGSWLEATKNYITIDVVDPQITVESLQLVFGSLYNDEVILNPNDIVPVLAAATMFQLDGIIEKCTEVMMETINPKTIFTYFDAASQYGHKKLKDACLYWFLVNLMTYYYSGSLVMLRVVPIPLMITLVDNPDLFVMQTEFSIYVMLKFWMFMHLHPELTESPPVKEINNFFCSRKGETAFLLTKEGEKFKAAFRGLRLHNLISHYMDVEMIERDNIIPQHWLNPVLLEQWKTMLKINQNEDNGPPSDLAKAVFLSKSLRCGRILNEKGRHMWRWTGFHYGIDLLMIADSTSISIKRNHRPEFEQLLSQQNSRNISIKVTVVSLNEQRQVIYKQTSEMRSLTLTKSEEITLMTLDKDVKFPLIISTNVMFTTPNLVEVRDQTIQTIG